MHNEAIDEKIKIVRQGILAKKEREAVASSTKQILQQMEKIAGMNMLIDDDFDRLKEMVDTRREEVKVALKEAVVEKSPLAHLPAKKQEMYQHLFSLIYDCSQNRTAAKALVDRIISKICADGEAADALLL